MISMIDQCICETVASVTMIRGFALRAREEHERRSTVKKIIGIHQKLSFFIITFLTIFFSATMTKL